MRCLIALGIIAGCRANDKDERTTTPSSSGVPQPHTAGDNNRPPIAAPVPPTLDRDAAPVLPETPNPSLAFDKQSRDSAWGSDTEASLQANARSMLLGRSDRPDGTVELRAFVDYGR